MSHSADNGCTCLDSIPHIAVRMQPICNPLLGVPDGSLLAKGLRRPTCLSQLDWPRVAPPGTFTTINDWTQAISHPQGLKPMALWILEEFPKSLVMAGTDTRSRFFCAGPIGKTISAVPSLIDKEPVTAIAILVLHRQGALRGPSASIATHL